MSSFSTALTKTLDALHWNQSQLAEASGIGRTQINRYVNGSGGIVLSAVDAIANAVPEEFQAGLLVAWLKDQIPHSLEAKVTIAPVLNRIQEDPNSVVIPPEADPELRKLIQWVVYRCIQNKEFRGMLENIWKLIERGK